MTKFLQRGHREYATTYALEYHDKDDPSKGFAFPCTKNGDLVDDHQMVILGTVTRFPWYKNYLACVNGENNTIFDGIVERQHSWWEPSVIECEQCSAEVVLDHTMINICDCGAEYNMSGQLLAPHDQWGEETGETYSDIAMSDRILY